MNEKFSGTNYLSDVTIDSTIFDRWSGNDNEISLYNFGGYKIVIVNLTFYTSSAFKVGLPYHPFTFPSIVRPSGTKKLLMGTKSHGAA